jgi:hypothetical protein
MEQYQPIIYNNNFRQTQADNGLFPRGLAGIYLPAAAAAVT